MSSSYDIIRRILSRHLTGTNPSYNTLKNGKKSPITEHIILRHKMKTIKGKEK